jgi:hypothetical protein
VRSLANTLNAGRAESMLMESSAFAPLGSVVAIWVPFACNKAMENWSGVPPASTSVVRAMPNDRCVPAVNVAAKILKKSLSTSVTPVPKVPVPPPVVSSESTAPALPPVPKKKLSSATVLLASAVPLPSMKMNASSNVPDNPDVSRLTDPLIAPAYAGPWCASPKVSASTKRVPRKTYLMLAP